MKTLKSVAVIAGLLLASHFAFAQAPAWAPAGATGLCNDGTYYTGATKSGACRGHKGVKTWYGATAASPSQSAAPSKPAPPPAPAAAPASPPPPTQAAAPAAKTAANTAVQAPGGGPGLVWLNTPTNVYHCLGTRYYGKTKTGQYMTEAAAKAKGAHAEQNKPCS
jgi:hypothetical protein